MSHQSQKTKLHSILLTLSFLTLSCMSIARAQPWDQTHKLLPSDGAADDNFGVSVSINGNTTIVGVPHDNDLGSWSGSAYVFDTTTGEQLFKLLPDDGAAYDYFGISVSIYGNTAIVGALGDDDFGDTSGSAYVFDTTTGEQLFKLLPSDEAEGDDFGISVSIYGNTAIVGANLDDDLGTNSGSAYVFDTTTGEQLFKILPDDGAADDLFGTSISIYGTTAIVGAYGDDANSINSGSAYVFDTTTGEQLFKILPDDGALANYFGYSVSINGTTAIVGAYGDNVHGTKSGSAYVFDTTTGEQLFKLLPDDGAELDRFGHSVSINGTTAIVGAYGDNAHGFDSGSAYVFDTTTGELLYKILADDGAAEDYFGYSVSINGTTAIVGALGDNELGSESGSAYMFDRIVQENCLSLAVDNLIAGQKATFKISGGTRGTRAVTAYGTKAGQTIVDNVSNFCATFGIKGVTQSKVLGGSNQFFDANGEINFNQLIPSGTTGTLVFFQSAMQNTCPDECISNLVQQIIQ